MRYTIKISYNDVLVMQCLNLRKQLRIMLLLFCVAFLTSVGTYPFRCGCHTNLITLLSAISSGAATGLCIVFLLFIIVIPWQSRKMYKHHKILHKPREYEFTEHSFNSHSEYGNTTVPWVDFYKWRENKKMFLVYQTHNAPHIIPKRIFTTSEEEQTLRTILTNALGKAK